MNIFINGQSHQVAISCTVEQALTLANIELNTSFALAVNQTFVGKPAYATTWLNENDSVDIMLPIQGG